MSITTILRTLAYSADLARPLARESVDVALERGLALLAARLPTRTIMSCTGDPYLSRTYLAGRLPKGFPADLRTVLGTLDGTTYLHRFHREDLEPEHHSHPWEWAVSVILSGSYVEEIVLADGSIATRERRPGSIGVLTAGSFHRVAELRSPAVRTLFITGPRTPDGMWYFRRLNGEVVPHDVFIAEREAERMAKDRASAPTVVETGPGGWWGDAFTMGPIGQPILASETAAARGLEVRADLSPVAVPVDAEPFQAPAADPTPSDWTDNAVEIGVAINVAINERLEEIKTALREHVDSPGHAAAVQSASNLGDGSQPPEGYTFEQPLPSPIIIVRHGDSYLGSLMSNGRAVVHGAEVKPAEVEKHATAWAHARALAARGAA